MPKCEKNYILWEEELTKREMVPMHGIWQEPLIGLIVEMRDDIIFTLLLWEAVEIVPNFVKDLLLPAYQCPWPYNACANTL